MTRSSLSNGDGVPYAEVPISDPEFLALNGSAGDLGCNRKPIREQSRANACVSPKLQPLRIMGLEHVDRDAF